MKMYIAGIHGMVGSAISNAAKAHSFQVLGKSSKQLDLLQRREVFRELEIEKPDVLIIAAAKVGGISANSSRPVLFLSENLQIQTNLLDAAHAAHIEKVVFLGSSCVYPKFASQPINERELLGGYLEPTNEPYAIAKIAGIKLVEAYRREYGHNWFSLMPTNIYGERDNFNLETAHVLPALIRKLSAAADCDASEVEIWGDGSPLREFIHADDLARACLFLIENEPRTSVINVGCGSEISISDLAKLISKIVGFKGKFIFNKQRPNGTPRKLLDSSVLSAMGWSPTISLEEGIIRTVDWYRQAGMRETMRK